MKKALPFSKSFPNHLAVALRLFHRWKVAMKVAINQQALLRCTDPCAFERTRESASDALSLARTVRPGAIEVLRPVLISDIPRR